MREVVRIYVPRYFVRRWARKVLLNREKYRDIEKALVSSRLPLTVHEYMAIASFYSTISFVVGLMLGILTVLTVPPTLILYVASYTPFYGVVIRNYGTIKVVYPLISLVFASVAYKLMNYLILSYPFFLSNRRKGEIELYLPHAINMMYGMARGGVPVYDIVRTIAESKHIFGELSREFLIIVEMVEVFKRNVYDGMRFVRDTTPSPQLSSFLDNLVFVLEGGGRLSEFLRRKSEELSEEKERTFESYIEFLGMMAEVYISVFVVFPLFLLIVLSVARILGGIFEVYRLIIMLILPLSTVFFIHLLRSMVPTPKVKLVELERRYELVKANVSDEFRRTFTIDRFKVMRNKVLRFILHPFRERIFDLDLRILSFHLGLLSLITFLIAIRYVKLEYSLLISFSVFILPFILIVEMKERIMRRTEERIPDVFSELAMLNEAGLTVLEGLKVLSQTEMGVLTREIVVMRKEIEWGVLIPRAFIRLGLRIRSDLMSKIVPIVVKALETAPTIKDAFNVVARYADSEVAFKKRMRSSTVLYVIIIYMCIVVFLATAYMMIVNFFKPFSNVTGGVSGYAVTVNVEDVKNSFFQIALLVGILSGIVAGQIGEGNPLLGLKHSYVFTVLTYLVFNMI